MLDHDRLTCMIAEAEALCGSRIFENLERARVEALPLPDRAALIGRAVMERGGQAGYRLGRRMVELAEAAQC